MAKNLRKEEAEMVAVTKSLSHNHFPKKTRKL